MPAALQLPVRLRLYRNEHMDVTKTDDGFYVVQGGVPPMNDPVASRYVRGLYKNTRYRFRDNPEIVDYLCHHWEGLADKIDATYYEKWVDALQRAQIIKRGAELPPVYWMKLDPYDHQVMATWFALCVPACALFMEPGTGKTY